jgi:hypothetical protein
LPQQGDAIDVGQHEIQQHHVGPPLPEQLNGARANRRCPHFVRRRALGLLDHHLQPVSHHRLVVNDKHPAPVRRLCSHRMEAKPTLL